MSIVSYKYFTLGFKCEQVYHLLYDEGFYDEAKEFCRKVDWYHGELSNAKKFFKTISLPSDIKNQVFLILNNKACYYSDSDNIYGVAGFGLMRGIV